MKDYEKEPLFLRLPVWAVVLFTIILSAILATLLMVFTPTTKAFYTEIDGELTEVDRCYMDRTIKRMVCEKDGFVFTVEGFQSEVAPWYEKFNQ